MKAFLTSYSFVMAITTSVAAVVAGALGWLAWPLVGWIALASVSASVAAYVAPIIRAKFGGKV